MSEITLQDIIKPENLVYKKTSLMTNKALSYCPGCGHGTTHRLIMEVIEELGKENETIGVAPVGCSVLAYEFMNVDMQEAAHGRAPALATAIKRLWPGKVVFTYQGDGDLAAIGTAEIIHAANRGENITTIFVNNAVYGMTRGQMAPTTMLGQKTTTTISGRDPKVHGYPIRVCELLAVLDGTTYIERIALIDPSSVQKIKRAIRKGFECQLAKKGFSLIEVLSPCPVNWGLEPIEALNFIKEKMVSTFPPGVIKDNFTANGLV